MIYLGCWGVVELGRRVGESVICYRVGREMRLLIIRKGHAPKGGQTDHMID